MNHIKSRYNFLVFPFVYMTSLTVVAERTRCLVKLWQYLITVSSPGNKKFFWLLKFKHVFCITAI